MTFDNAACVAVLWGDSPPPPPFRQPTQQRLEDPSSAQGLTPEETEARDEAREKFRILRTVLEQGGHFSGINRCVFVCVATVCIVCAGRGDGGLHTVLEQGGHFSGINRCGNDQGRAPDVEHACTFSF